MQTGERPTGDAPATVQTLSSLAELHDRGALTDDEFRAAKARLLRVEIDVAVPNAARPPRRVPPPPPPARPAGTGLTTPVPPAAPDAAPPTEATALPRLYRRLYHLNGPQHAALVARRAGVPQDQVEQMVTQLVADGLVHRHPNGLIEMRPGAPMPRGAASRGPLSTASPATTSRHDDVLRPVRLGLWAIPVLLLGIIGGTIGHLVLRRRDPRRARHVLGTSVQVTAFVLFVATVAFAAMTVLDVV